MSDILTELIDKVRKGVIRLEDLPTDKLILIKNHHYYLSASLKIKNIKEDYVFYKSTEKNKNREYLRKKKKYGEYDHLIDLNHSQAHKIEYVLERRGLNKFYSKSHTLKTSADLVNEWNNMVRTVVLDTLEKTVNQLTKEDDIDFEDVLNEVVEKNSINVF